jgi:uncharacterized membrane protein
MKMLDRHHGFAEFTVHMSSFITFATIAYVFFLVQKPPFFSGFPMFVPSLSWQNDSF